MRDASIVYAVGEFLSNTQDHFNDCAKFIEPRSSSSGCKIILTSKVCCMKGGVRFLINRAHIVLITIPVQKFLNKEVQTITTCPATWDTGAPKGEVPGWTICPLPGALNRSRKNILIFLWTKSKQLLFSK